MTNSGNMFKYAMCNESMQELSWQQQCRIISEAGYGAIEVAPFTLVNQGVADISAGQRKEMAVIMQDEGLVCDGLHWLFSPPPDGLHFTTSDQPVRRKSVAYLDELIDFCGDLNGSVMIFGSPKQRSTIDGMSIGDAKKYFAEGLVAVSDHAQSRGVKIMVEHLDKTQSDVINTLDEAWELVERIGHPAIQMMFDFHNTADETESLDVLVKRHFDHIYHVHIQEMDGQYLGMGTAADDFLTTFQVLKDLNYDRWISLEVFDFAPGGKTIARESMRVMKEMEAKLS